MKEFAALLSPLDIGAVRVRNRVLVSAHVPGFAEDGKPGKDYINYHRQYAAAGVGLQMTGGTAVHRSGLLSLNRDSLVNLDDSIIPGYRNLSDSVHSEGGRILAQLAHSAGTVLINHPGRQSWSASPVRSQTTGNISHEMTISEIREVVDAHGAAAERVAEGNLDGVEILGAFGFLPQAFLSPLSNWREDEYGGCLENRMRFLVEVLGVVRQALGREKILGVRLPGDECEPGGLDLGQMKVICRKLCETGWIDYLNITAHTNFTHKGRSRHWAPTPTPHGVFVGLAAAVKKAVDLPVFTVGRIVDPGHADSIIASGRADMVGMTRAHICDPHIVARIKENAPSRIRPCVGANTCVANRYLGKTIRCMHNPAVARPGAILRKAKRAKNIMIVGAGPGGLEAGRIAAQRGHRVSVYDANDYAGGQLALWAKSHSMKELGKIIDWRLSELDRMQCRIEFNRKIQMSDIRLQKPDDVIIATGAVDNPRTFQGKTSIGVMTPHQLLVEEDAAAEKALVISDGRGQAGLAAAEWLAHKGADVELMTSDIAVAADLDPTHRNAWYERLGTLDVKLTARMEIIGLDRDRVFLQDVFCRREEERNAVDLIIDWNGCRVNDELLRAGKNDMDKIDFHAVGDCIAPRNVEVAIAEAYRLAENI